MLNIILMKGLKEKLSDFFKFFWPILTIALIVSLFFWKVFLKGQVPIPADFVIGVYYPWLDYKWGYEVGVPVKNPITTDVVSFTFPMQTLAIDMLKKGEVPLWNPYILAGTPLLANFQSAPFSPTNFLYFLFDKLSAWSFQIVLQHILAGVFTYLLLRGWRVSKLGSIFGGTIFAFSGFNLIWSQWNGHTLAAAFIPLTLLFMDRWLLKGLWIYGVGISLSIFLLFLSGYPQVALYLAIAMGILWLIRAKNVTGLIPKTILLGAFCLIGLGLASFQVLPGAELLNLSQREVEPHPFEWAFLPWQKIITFVAPDFYGNHSTGNYWGPQDYTSNTGFVGVVALVFAFLGMKGLKRKKEILFSTILLIAALVFAFPTPVSIFLWKSGIFGLNAASAHRSLVLFNLGVALLAGFGIDNLQKQRGPRAFWVFLPAAFLITGFATYAFFFLKGNMGAVAKNVVALRNLVIPTTALFSSLVIYLLIIKKVLSKNIAVVLFFAVAVVELFRFGWKFTPFSPKNIVFPTTPILDYLESREKPVRLTGSKVIPINMKMPYKLESLEGYDAVYPLRVAKFLAALSGKRSGTQPLGRYGTVDNDTSELLDLVNTKYYLTLKYEKDPSPKGNIPDRFDPNRFLVSFEDKTTVVLESKTALPRAFIVYDWEVIGEADKILDRLLSGYPFANKIILEEEPSIKTSVVSKQSKVEMVSYKENESVYTVEAEKDGMLFISDSYYPGWNAYIDGRLTKIYRANYNFRAVSVPFGKHTVRFVYEPESFKKGIYYSAFSLLFLVLLFPLGKLLKLFK